MGSNRIYGDISDIWVCLTVGYGLHSQEKSVDRNWGTQVTQTPNLEGQAATESRSSIWKPL